MGGFSSSWATVLLADKSRHELKGKVMVHLLSVNAGLPRDVEWQGRLVNAAIWKTPVKGPCMVRRLNIDGGGQADRAGHGGENRVVICLSDGFLPVLGGTSGRCGFVYGQFGENFMVDGLADAEVCIGDPLPHRRRCLQVVSQPRVTCYQLGIRMELPEMAALLVSHGRPGFYLRVLKEGKVQEGDEVEHVASAEDGMTVAAINDLLYKPGHPRDRLERALRISALSPGWRRSFQSLLEQSPKNGASPGNAGLAGVNDPGPAWEDFARSKCRACRSRVKASSLLSSSRRMESGCPTSFQDSSSCSVSSPEGLLSYCGAIPCRAGQITPITK